MSSNVCVYVVCVCAYVCVCVCVYVCVCVHAYVHYTYYGTYIEQVNTRGLVGMLGLHQGIVHAVRVWHRHTINSTHLLVDCTH